MKHTFNMKQSLELKLMKKETNFRKAYTYYLFYNRTKICWSESTKSIDKLTN